MRLSKSAAATTPVGSTGNATAAINGGTGTATSTVAKKAGDPIQGVAVSFVSDPATIEPTSTGSPGSVDVTIGTSGDLLSLEADSPGDVASALYELMIGTETLFSLEIDVDSSTISLQSADFTLSVFDAASAASARRITSRMSCYHPSDLIRSPTRFPRRPRSKYLTARFSSRDPRISLGT